MAHRRSAPYALITLGCYSLAALQSLACTAEIQSDRPSDIAGAGAAGTGGAGGGAISSGAAAGVTSQAGSSGSGGTTSGGVGGTGTGGGGTANVGDPESAGPLPLRHLTSREYRNTVSDLLGDSSLGENDVPNETSDPTFEYFPFRRPSSVGVIEAEALQFAAETVARNVSGNVLGLLPCSPEALGETECAAEFVADFGRRAYRRPLEEAESTRLVALYEEARTELALDFAGAIGLLVEAILQSPAFYYHFEREPGPAELTPSTNVVKLGPYQLASRMSYFLWGSMPDPALFAAAENGALASAAGVEAEARRMLELPRARETVVDFFDDLFDLDVLLTRAKDTDAYPTYGVELQEAMRAEVGHFVGLAVFDGPGTFAELLTSTRTKLNEPLAGLYGVSGVTGLGFVDAELNPAERGGVLTLAAFLANSAAAAGSLPPRRGKFVYTRLLCTDLPPPPPDVPAPAEPMPGLSTRQRFEAHGQNPCAAGCHIILDSLGFAFENFDGVGAHRAVDMGVAVDASGSFAFDGTTDISYADARELSAVLAADAGAGACFGKQWLRYALRRPETDADLHSLATVDQAFRATGGNVKELLVAITTSNTFRQRSAAAGETLP